MPRNPGTGVYTKPAPDVVAGTTVESKVYNDFVNDVALDLNTPRPVVAGGTGADDAKEARDNLDAEVAGVQVTNFDTHIWESGSFWSFDATGQPPQTGRFSGSCVVLENNNQNYVQVSAVAQADGTRWTKRRGGGVWTAWAVESSGQFVDVAGDTMTGNLTITKAVAPNIILNKTADVRNEIIGQKNGVNRWGVILGSAQVDAGAGANTGSEFAITRYNDAGTQIDSSILISRATGQVSMGGVVAYSNKVKIQRMGFGVLPPSGDSGALNITPIVNEFGISYRPGADTGAGSFYPAQFNAYPDNQVGYIACTVTGTTYNTGSDGRLKEDFKSFDAGNIVDKTNVYDFAWKSTGERSYGIVAQQANEVYPAAVSHIEHNDTWGIDYSKYVPVILQELKALRARVAELEVAAGIRPAPPGEKPA